MSGFRSKLKAVFEGLRPTSSGTQHQQTFNRPAPLQPYWTANFSVEGRVSDEWEQELGDHGWGNNELQNYTASDENCGFRAGGDHGPQLILRAIVRPDTATSARLTSRVTLGRDQGYLSARITVPTARGVWPAFWLLPSEPFTWPTDGEVDIMESWNREEVNHSCLHWGHYNDQDREKHRVVETRVRNLDHPEGVEYGFAWHQSKGKFVWYVDSKPVMQTGVPSGIRTISNFQVKLNVALGGDVCHGTRPSDGSYEMVVHALGLFESPPGGWEDFDRRLCNVPDGKPRA